MIIISAFFIITFSPASLVYILIFTVLNYSIGITLHKYNSPHRKHIYYFGQTLNIAGLFFFKYINFLIENINNILGLFIKNEVPHIDLLIPIGLSYYTFQAISYLYIIYKTKEAPEECFSDFLLYMLFWPKIIAGPIEKHNTFLNQLKHPLKYDYDRIISGGRLFMWGLFKKMLIADTFSIVVTAVYHKIEFYSGIPLLLAFLIQPIQVYCDFSGYTDMALGIAKIFGIQLSENFKRPFMAKNVGDFWRRWHISLTKWCTTYIYNRLLLKHRKWNNFAIYYATFISFTFIGLWHGPKWTFIILGFLQVIAIIYEFKTRKFRIKIQKYIPVHLYTWGSRIIVYLFFASSLVFLFSKDMSDALYFFNHMFKIESFHITSIGVAVNDGDFYLAILFSVVILLYDLIKEENLHISLLKNSFNHPVVRWSVYVLWIFAIVYFSKNQGHFVYEAF